MWTLCHGAVQIYPKPTQSIEESTELQTLLTPACPSKIASPLHLWKQASLLSCSDFGTHKIGSLLLKFSCCQECTLILTITPKSAQLADMLLCCKLVDTGRWPCCCAPEAILLMRHISRDNLSISRLTSWWPNDLLRTQTHVASCAWLKHGWGRVWRGLRWIHFPITEKNSNIHGY